MRSLATALIVAFLAGCVSPSASGRPEPVPPIPYAAKYDDAEFAWAREKGDASVAGEIWAKQRNGNVLRGAGSSVMAIPANAYSAEWLDASTLDEIRTEVGEAAHVPADPRALQSARSALADSNGKFEIDGLAPGKWTIVARMEWLIATTNHFEEWQVVTLTADVGLAAAEHTTAPLKVYSANSRFDWK